MASQAASSKAVEIVQAFTRAVHSGDEATARSLAKPDLSFRGPLDSFDRLDDYLAALKQLAAIVTGTEPEATVADGNQVSLFYILKTKVADAPVAEWYTVEGDRVSAVRAYFDARPFAQAAGGSAG